MVDPGVSFRPVMHSDIPLLGAWMTQQHWLDWWGDPQTELAMIEDMIDERDTTRPFLFCVDGVAKGYIQVWFCADWHQPPYTETDSWILDLPRDAVGVDLSIGEADELARGLGSRVLRTFCERLRGEGHGEIFIDPDPENTRAIRAYRKAGFATYKPLAGRTEDVLILRHQPDFQGTR
jgi:aminoglycoside 6'-N-acetyltransferase